MLNGFIDNNDNIKTKPTSPFRAEESHIFKHPTHFGFMDVCLCTGTIKTTKPNHEN